jgi:hypothetical protein
MVEELVEEVGGGGRRRRWEEKPIDGRKAK